MAFSIDAEPRKVPRPPAPPQSWGVADAVVVAVLTTGLVAGSLYVVNWNFFTTLAFPVVIPYLPILLRGFAWTLILTGLSMAIAMLIGMVLANAGHSHQGRLGGRMISAYVEIGRNLPIIVIIFWVHFALPTLSGISTPVLVSGLLAMTLQSTAMLTAVLRAGIAAVDRGQSEAGAALGLSKRVTQYRVILPQALVTVMPGITNIFISMLKASAVLSALSLGELWNIAQQVASYTFKPLETLTLAAALYVIAGQVIIWAMWRAERSIGYPR